MIIWKWSQWKTKLFLPYVSSSYPIKSIEFMQFFEETLILVCIVDYIVFLFIKKFDEGMWKFFILVDDIKWAECISVHLLSNLCWNCGFHCS